MAIFKNLFIKSKMNKDLDDRLLPQGEYRDAENIQVSKSEGEDVGALENVLGNSEFIDFTDITSNTDIQCIGYLVSEINSCFYFFLTDNGSEGYNTLAENYIVRSIVSQGTITQNEILVRGAFLNFSTLYPIYGVNLLEELLFWTDNRNQPRKINVNLAKILPPLAIGFDYYAIEDTISVAKVMPFTAPTLWQEVTQEVIDESGDPTRLQPALGEYQTTMQDVVSPFLPDGTTANPYEDVVYRGDPDYLEDKFVRFSYRFKFDDGEYSVFAPFTQECFIPQQDGYFLFPDAGATPGSTGNDNNDMSAAYRSTIVEFMENKVNQLTLLIEMPVVGDPALGTTNLFNVSSYFKITEIEILFKESDGAAVLVVDTIPADDIKDQFSSSNPTNNVYQYKYSGTKPFRTLPESQLTRVYDKVPVKALSQEVISNRVVYGNFQTRHTPPNGLNYNVGTGPKQPFDITTPVTPVSWNTSIIEYPSSTLKQNRNYQAGFVFSDKFGRTTSTILSNTGDVASSATASSLSTVYSPYNDNLVDIGLWPGDTLLIQVNDTISETPVASNLYPGTYNGDPADALYNPLGFKSWKIVVKQQEQDYYNVYLPGILASYPEDPTKELGLTSHAVLINDNINKVPRDLSQVGPDQKQFRSSVQLFGRVENTATAPSTTNPSTNLGVVNQQYYPSRFSDTVSTIQDEFSQFNVDLTTPPIPTELSSSFYEAESNPLIARISTTNEIGQIEPTSGGFTYSIFNLAVYETEPVESRLDIYWETSSSGTIDDLNEQVIATGGQTIFGIINDSWFLNEYFNKQTTASSPWSETALNASPEPGPAPASPVIGPLNAEYGRYRSVVMGPFWFDDNTNTPIQNVELDSFSVEDGNNTVVTSDFDILRIKGTGSTPAGIGNYIDFNGATTTTYTHDTFILVNKAFHLYDSADVPATQFTLVISVKDLDNPNPPPIPIKTFTLTNTLDGTTLDDVPTVQVGGQTLITTPGYVNTSWGQTTNTPIDYGQQPNLAGGAPGQIVIQVGYTGIPLKLYGSNGSNVAFLSPSQNQNSLFWDIPVQTKAGLPSTAFQIDSATGEVTETSFGVARGQYDLKIRVSAYGTQQTIITSIVIGVPTANGSFNNSSYFNTAGNNNLPIDFGFIYNLHNSTTDAYDQIPNSSGGNSSTTFKYTFPDPGNIPAGTSLNDSFSNSSCGSYPATGGGPNTLILQQPTGSGTLEGPLTQGTGYVAVFLTLTGQRGGTTFNEWASCNFSWAIEYRENSTVPWKAATDIEGNVLSWNGLLAGSTEVDPQQSGKVLDDDSLGGTNQPVSWSQPQSSGSYIQDQVYGAAGNNAPVSSLIIPAPNPNTYQLISRNRSSVSTNASETVLSKWVAVGNSPTYGTTPCFGEYRVIIQTIGGQDSSFEDACVGCFADPATQPFPVISFEIGEIEFGDFFYDLGPQRAFAYLVDTKTFLPTSSGKSQALNNNFGIIGSRYKILYALEPVHRYVSTFYSDPALTVPFIAWDLSVGGNPGYISYRSFDGNGSVPGSTPPFNAGVTSITNQPNAQSAEGAGSPSANPNTLQDKRVWACLMEASTGTKLMGTSIGKVG